MTNKTPEQIDADTEAFLEHVIAGMPESMPPEHIAYLLHTIVVSYCLDGVDAGLITLQLATLVRDYYSIDADDGECMCDNCVARRKANAH
jgi:hypothetical protein